MKKKLLYSAVALMVAGILMSFFQERGYWQSILLNNRLVMQPDVTTSTQSAEIYFEAGTPDQGTYIYESTDGNLSLVTETSVIIPAGFLTGNSLIRGQGAFTTTEEVDTVVIAGLLATDFVVVGGEYLGGVDQQDVLQAEVKADTLIVHRLAAGESAAVFNYIVVR